jgi:hypothetical protein
MSAANRCRPIRLFVLALGLAALAGCVVQRPPTLDEVRTGRTQGAVTADTALQPDEIRGEVTALDPARREIRVRTDDGRTRVLVYDRPDTLVTYHDWGYRVDQLEAGDLIAFRTRARDRDEVASIRIQEPVQARAGSTVARSLPGPRAEVVEGTVERVQYDTGIFEIQPRTGRSVTVSVPYNARTADVENFRRLRRGDYVRVEGEFTNADNLQLLSFLSPR